MATERGDCVHPDCLVLTTFGCACEHSCPFEADYRIVFGDGRPRPEPYLPGCLALEVPGATCLSPNCDC